MKARSASRRGAETPAPLPERHASDYVLLFTVLALMMFGLVMVFSTSGALADKCFGQPHYYVLRQLLWGGLGLSVMVLLAHIPYRFYQKRVVAGVLAVLVPVLLIAVLFQPAVNGEIGRAHV